jgi:hypothetical protein
MCDALGPTGNRHRNRDPDPLADRRSDPAADRHPDSACVAHRDADWTTRAHGDIYTYRNPDRDADAVKSSVRKARAIDLPDDSPHPISLAAAPRGKWGEGVIPGNPLVPHSSWRYSL